MEAFIIFQHAYPVGLLLALSICVSLTITALVIILFRFFVHFRSIKRGRIFFNVRKLVSEPQWPALIQEKPNYLIYTLHWAGIKKIPNFKICLVVALAALFVFGVVFGWKGILFGFLVFIMGAIYILRQAVKRKQIFVNDLPEALRSFADAFRSGFSTPQALQFLAREIPDPVGGAFRALARSGEFQMPFADAAESVAMQLNIPEWQLFTEMITVQGNVGGNFVPLLQEFSRTLQDARTAAEEIQSLTAAGRMSGIMVTALMPITLLMFTMLSPTYTDALFGTVLGRLAFSLAVILELIGAIWIYFLVRADY